MLCTAKRGLGSQFRIRDTARFASRLTQFGETGLGKQGWGWELGTQSQGCRQIRIEEQAGEFRKELIADRGEFVFALRALDHQLRMMLNHSAQLRCGLSGRSKSANRLEGIIHLDAFLQLIVELVGQAQSITLIRFEESLPPLLNMDNVHGNIQILQVLHQGSMIVARDFQQDLNAGPAAHRSGYGR